MFNIFNWQICIVIYVTINTVQIEVSVSTYAEKGHISWGVLTAL